MISGDMAPRAVSEESPSDKNKIVFIIQFLYGIAILLPFNILVACLDFYEERVSEETGTSRLAQPFSHCPQ